MKILRRYILREHVGPFIAALGVLTGLMLLNQLAKRFSDLVGKGLPWYVIGEVFGLSIPFILAMTMPMAVLVAVLYTFSRLSGDNEITAIKAGGVSLFRLMFPVLIAASAVATGMIWFNDRLLPESNHALRMLLSDIGRKQPTFELRERVINEVVDGKLFLQTARIDRMRSVMRDLIIFDLGRPNVNRTIYADSGFMAFNETQTDLYLTLFDGSMHELDTEDPTMEQRTYYGKQVFRVPDVSNELERGRGTDWRGDREMNITMMQMEVLKRRDRLKEIDDSIQAIIDSSSPVRTPPTEGDRVSETILLDIPGDSAIEDRQPERPRQRSDIGPETPPPPREERSAISREELRARYSVQRGQNWPPNGTPVGYSVMMRNEFQRIASRRDLQRRERARYAVEIQKKFAIPVAAIVFVLIGAPVGVRFQRGGIGMVIGVSLTVFCVYYVFLIGGEEFADRNYMSPFWSMWAPNVLFAALGCIIFFFVTRSGTRRFRLVPSWLRRWSSAIVRIIPLSRSRQGSAS